MKKEMLKEIVNIANILDSSGFIREANVLDNIAKRVVTSQTNNPVQNPNQRNPNAPLNTKELNSKLFKLMNRLGWVNREGAIIPIMGLVDFQNFWFEDVQPAFNLKDPAVAQWLTSKFLEYKKSLLKSAKEEQDKYNKKTFFGLFPDNPRF
ncbi:MAG: hypothetical protein RL621_1588 [Bacteroidota bacterium]|jgi:hypothetical protein